MRTLGGDGEEVGQAEGPARRAALEVHVDDVAVRQQQRLPILVLPGNQQRGSALLQNGSHSWKRPMGCWLKVVLPLACTHGE